MATGVVATAFGVRNGLFIGVAGLLLPTLILLVLARAPAQRPVRRRPETGQRGRNLSGPEPGVRFECPRAAATY